MHIPEVAYPVHTDDSNLDLIPRPAGQRGPSTLDRLKVTNTVARKSGREEAGKLMVTAAESKRGPSKIQPLDLPQGRVNDSQLCTTRQLLSHCIYPYYRNFSLFSPISQSHYACLPNSFRFMYICSQFLLLLSITPFSFSFSVLPIRFLVLWSKVTCGNNKKSCNRNSNISFTFSTGRICGRYYCNIGSFKFLPLETTIK